MAQGDIAVNLIGQNNITPAVNQAVASYGSLNGAINQHMNRLAGESRAQMQFNRMIDETIREMKQLETAEIRAARGANTTAGGMAKASGSVNQLVYAVDDAIAGFSTGGFAGAVRGAGNNISTFAMQVGGAKAAMVGIGAVAGAQLLVPFIKELQDSLSLTKNLEQRLDRMRTHGENRREGLGADFNDARIGERVGEIGSTDQAAMRLKELQAERDRMQQVDITSKQADLQKLDNELATLKQQREGAQITGRVAAGGVSGLAENLPLIGGSVQRATRFAGDTFANQVVDEAAISKVQEARDRETAELNKMTRNLRSVNEEIAALERAMPDLQQREADAFGAQQQQDDLRREREARQELAAGRRMAGSLRSELMAGDINPEVAAQGRKEQIAAELFRRESEINALGNVDPVLRGQMLADAQAIAVQQMTRIDRDRGAGLSARGPSALRSGDAETLRFLNQARLGASAKSSEEKRLEEIAGINREMLTALRDQKRAAEDAEPPVTVDF